MGRGGVTNTDVLQGFVNYINEDEVNPYVLVLDKNVLQIELNGSGSTYYYTITEGASITAVHDKKR